MTLFSYATRTLNAGNYSSKLTCDTVKRVLSLLKMKINNVFSIKFEVSSNLCIINHNILSCGKCMK